MNKIDTPVFIYLDNVRRDYLVADVLRAYLESKKFKVFLISNETYMSVIKLIPSKLIIFIKNYFQVIPSEILEKIKRKKLFFLILDAEGAQTEDRCKFWVEKYNIDVRSQTKAATKIFLWNNTFLNYISSFTETNKDKFIVCGSPKISISILAENFLKQKSESKNNNIGLVCRFSAINDFNDRSCLYNTAEHFFALDEFKMGAQGEILSLFCYLEIIEYLIKNTKYNINIRPHPNEKLESYDVIKKEYGNRIKISSHDQDFIEWMYENDKIICTPSTSIVEPIINDIPLISIHKIVKGTSLRAYVEKMLNPFLTKINSPGNFDELKQLINKKDLKNLESNQEFEEAKGKYYGNEKDMKLNAMKEIAIYLKNNFYSDKKRAFLFSNIIYLFLNFPTYLKYKILKKKKYIYSPDYNCFLIKNKKISKLIAKELAD